MKNIVIYTKDTCPYCVMAKNLLQKNGLSYTEIRVDLDEQEREKMIERSGRYTVPQIFFDDTHIGGYDDLYTYFSKSHSSE